MDEKYPRFSVVIPFRNAERTLERCLGSLIAPGRGDVEIVAVDDGSTDGSLAIARRLAEACPERISIHAREQSGGAQRARRDGVAGARGEIVVFTDADCEAPADLFDRVSAALDDEFVAVGGQYRVPPGLPLVARFETRSLLDYWYAHMPADTDHVATGCCGVWRRHLTTEVMDAGLAMADLTSGDDTLMSLELARHGRLRYDPELYVFHHTRTSLRAYLGQQLRRGQSRSRISVGHFGVKVRRARDTRMGVIAAQIASAYLAVLATPFVALSAWPFAAPLVWLPFLLLQVSLLRAALAARESLGFFAAAPALALLRNLAWGVGGVRGAMAVALRRPSRQGSLA